MKRHRRALRQRYGKALWSNKVKTKYHTSEGLFAKSAHVIARTLREGAADTGQAIRRLTFYINRAGRNLSSGARERLHKAVRILEGRS
jgi:Protein of unknown function (DUF3175)